MKKAVKSETRLTGVALSQGCAVARVCLFNEKRHSKLPLYRVAGDGVEREVARFKETLHIAEERLEDVRRKVQEKIGEAEAGIFAAQQMILRDETLSSGVVALIRGETINAEAAISKVLDEYETRVSELDNEYIRERASDFGEVKRRLLDVLSDVRPSLECAGEEHCQRGKNRIVVAAEMTPALMVDLDVEHMMGLVAERGGPGSHGAILARALGIPAVSGLRGIRGHLSCGTELLVNGATGEVIIWPTEETLRATHAARAGMMRLPKPVAPVAGFRVMANVNTVEDAKFGVEMQAEGVGLYRTEMDLIGAETPLGEEELYARYSKVGRLMGRHPVTFRLFDIGSDKPVPFLGLPREDNPALGWRGARLLLGHKGLLRTQARAIARVSAERPVQVLYPMIVDAAQFRLLRRRFTEAVADIACGTIQHGVMFEVPAACLEADDLLAAADFGSIGTNDLTQYLFAVDRGNEQVAADYNPDRPVLWGLIRSIVGASTRAGKPLSVCGELAGDPKFVAKLREAGVVAVSVNPRQIPAVRTAAAVAPGVGP